MKTRGQAAMEFLMTYGWAILAAIIVIGVLAIYFRPGQLTSNSVVVTAPFYGSGVTFAVSQVQVEVKNNGGETLTPTNATLTGTGLTCGNGAFNPTGDLAAGATTVITFACTAGVTAGATVNGNIAVSYTRPGTTLVLQSTGSVAGKVA